MLKKQIINIHSRDIGSVFIFFYYETIIFLNKQMIQIQFNCKPLNSCIHLYDSCFYLKKIYDLPSKSRFYYVRNIFAIPLIFRAKIGLHSIRVITAHTTCYIIMFVYWEKLLKPIYLYYKTCGCPNKMFSEQIICLQVVHESTFYSFYIKNILFWCEIANALSNLY